MDHLKQEAFDTLAESSNLLAWTYLPEDDDLTFFPAPANLALLRDNLDYDEWLAGVRSADGKTTVWLKHEDEISKPNWVDHWEDISRTIPAKGHPLEQPAFIRALHEALLEEIEV